jgi:MFS family permease
MVGTTAFFYGAELAQDEFGWKGLYSVIVIAAAPTTLAGYLVGGRLSDRIGRKPVTWVAIVLLAVGAVVMHTEQRWLFAPGFFLMAASEATLQSTRATFVSELFPTEVRATLASFVGAANVVAGSIGLVVVGLLASVVEPETTIMGLAVVCAATVLALRRLPETSGVDVTAPAPLAAADIEVA